MWPTSYAAGSTHIDLNVSDLTAAKAVYGPFLEFLGYTCVTDDAERCAWDLPGEGRGTSFGLKPCDPALSNYAHKRYAPGLHASPGVAGEKPRRCRCGPRAAG